MDANNQSRGGSEPSSMLVHSSTSRLQVCCFSAPSTTCPLFPLWVSLRPPWLELRDVAPNEEARTLTARSAGSCRNAVSVDRHQQNAEANGMGPSSACERLCTPYVRGRAEFPILEPDLQMRHRLRGQCRCAGCCWPKLSVAGCGLDAPGHGLDVR